MTKAFQQQPDMSQTDEEIGSANYQATLRPGELLTGTPTVIEDGSAVLDLTNPQVNSETYIDSNTNRQVEVGQAVVWAVKMKSGQEAPGNWSQKVEVTTTRGRKLVRHANLRTT